MKVLIGTPIHEVKDYSMERFLENVSKLAYPADLLMVDNSEGTAYLEKVRGYCEKYGIKNYKLEHIEVHQANGPDERIGRSREVIREEILKNGYDLWFSWECDQIIPVDTVDKLIALMKTFDFDLVSHNSWGRGGASSDDINTDFGCTIIQKRALEKHGFLLANEIMEPKNCWHGGEAWFRKRLLRSGGTYMEAYGIITPILHLDG